MTQLIILLIVFFSVALALAWGASYLGIRHRIAGEYNRARLMPDEMDTRLRSTAKFRVTMVLVAAGVLTLVCVLVHDIFFPEEIGLWIARSIVLSALFDESLLPLQFLFGGSMPLILRHLILYLLMAASLAAGAWLGIRLGLRGACKHFLLTRSFYRPRVVRKALP